MAASSFFDRVKVNAAAAPGTGAFAIGSPVTNYRGFTDAAVPDGAVVSYVIEDGASWECGQGTYSVAAGAVTRSTVRCVSGGGTVPIAASANATLFIGLLAEDLAMISTAAAAATSKPLAVSQFPMVVGSNGIAPNVKLNSRGALVIGSGAYASGDNVRFVGKTVPAATPWSVKARLKLLTPPIFFAGSGLAMLNATTGALVTFFADGNAFRDTQENVSIPGVVVESWSSATAFNKAYTATRIFDMTPEWMQVSTQDGSVYTFSVSHDGENFLPFYVSPSGFFSPSHIGFGVHFSQVDALWGPMGGQALADSGLLYCLAYSDADLTAASD